MGRSPCCDHKAELKKGPWTPEEDRKLVDYIQKHGHGKWRTLPNNAGLKRCGKSCRLRWTNYLRPDIKRGSFSLEEEENIIQLHSLLGNKWSAIAASLPGRTDNEVKNYWNTHIKKRLLKMGIDPVTHTPCLNLLQLSSILTSSLYGGASQLDLFGLENNIMPVNPKLLSLASTISFLSSQSETPNTIPNQFLPQNQPMQLQNLSIPNNLWDFSEGNSDLLSSLADVNFASSLPTVDALLSSSYVTSLNSSCTSSYVNSINNEEERDTGNMLVCNNSTNSFSQRGFFSRN